MSFSSDFKALGIETLPGYLNEELPPLEKRLVDTYNLSRLGKIAISSAPLTGLDHRVQLLSEASRTSSRYTGLLVVGPYVLGSKRHDEKYFAPRGLAVWELNANTELELLSFALSE